MALVVTTLVSRDDFAILGLAWLDGDTTGTITNGTGVNDRFNFRNTSGAVVAPVAMICQLNTQAALSSWTGVVAAVADITATKLAGAGGTGAASAATLYLWGPKSKGVA
jgi:hypothetical protein